MPAAAVVIPVRQARLLTLTAVTDAAVVNAVPPAAAPQAFTTALRDRLKDRMEEVFCLGSPVP